ncbi:MAG: ATP-dependent metallopeptidase FtsH/Yme1/Tma family protein, partial [Xanthomonadales bacterium]|nr:ATP-dependent metallopeptidase FtsH/Yme1/Tma family protein [Xanthomonadales bacterium]
MNDLAKNVLLWTVIAMVLLAVFRNFGPGNGTVEAKSYSEFVALVDRQRIEEIRIDGAKGQISGTAQGGEKFAVNAPVTEDLLKRLEEKGVKVEFAPRDTGSPLFSLFLNLLPVIVLIGFWIFMMRQMQGGGGGRGAMSFGKSRARLQGEDQVRVTFADVAGVDEAKEEVKELVEFLRDPGKFQRLGGRIPRGVLMVGSPGTGKTLLAKAIAGEAKVPFFTISGSDFVEMFVGVGASRVRDMFEQAKKHAPCIIFI